MTFFGGKTYIKKQTVLYPLKNKKFKLKMIYSVVREAIRQYVKKYLRWGIKILLLDIFLFFDWNESHGNCILGS